MTPIQLWLTSEQLCDACAGLQVIDVDQPALVEQVSHPLAVLGQVGLIYGEVRPLR
jgi:hypothetical protein